MKRPSPSLLRSPLAWALAGLLLAAAAAATWWFALREPPRQVATAPARVADVELTVLATGLMEAVQQVDVGAQVSGQIKSLTVVLGQDVKKGDPIAEIDSLPQKNALRQAQAAVLNLQAQRSARQATLAQARLAFARQEQLLAEDATSREAFEAAQAALRSAQADVEALEAQIAQSKVAIDTANLNLSYARITAPIDGKVVAVVAREGQTVNATQTAPVLVKLARLDTVTVKAEISEADVARVRPGMPVYFTTLGDAGQRYTATLRAVEPAPTTYGSTTSSTTTSTAAAVYYYGLFDVANPEGKLRIGMTAQVRIVLASAQQVLTVPAAALTATGRDGRASVRVQAEDGTISPREVVVGLKDSTQAEIREGLREGERVVIAEGSATLAPANLPRGRQPRMF